MAEAAIRLGFPAPDAGREDSLATVVEPVGGNRDLVAMIGDDREAVLTSLYQAGALLFRGFDVSDAAGFEAVTRAFTPKAFSYVGGGTPRSRISGEVFTSTEYSADLAIPLHNEASYFVELPPFVWFYCKIAPQFAGETPLGDMRLVLRRLDPALVARFEALGLCYVSNLHGGNGFGKSWQATYQSDDRDEVEQRVAEKGFEHSWLPDGTLRVLMRAPVVRTHTVTGAHYWGNQIANFHSAALADSTRNALQRLYGAPINYPKAVTFGDGSPIPDNDARAVAAALVEAETTFAWRAGDVLLIDNQAIAHGRRSFKGERQIMVALA